MRNLPPCRTVELPGRGKTYVADSGPVADSPTFLLLHSVACTGLMTWYPALEMMRGYGRVIVFDQRWHGHGIHSPGFALEACADDVAALADALGISRFIAVGYSMGSLVAQLVWRRHRQLVDGLVLCAGAATFARARFEQVAMRLFAAAIEASALAQDYPPFRRRRSVLVFVTTGNGCGTSSEAPVRWRWPARSRSVPNLIRGRGYPRSTCPHRW